MAQWAWHSFPGADEFTLDDAMKPIEAHGRTYLYPYVDDWSEADGNPAFSSLRENPHRFALGRLSLVMPDGEGVAAPDYAAIEAPRQTLDMWRGEARSLFVLNGAPVEISRARCAASITSSNRFGTLSTQSSTVTRAMVVSV